MGINVAELNTLFQMEKELQAYVSLTRWKIQMKAQIYVKQPTSGCQRIVAVRDIATELQKRCQRHSNHC